MEISGLLRPFIINVQRIYIFSPHICTHIFNLGTQILCAQNWINSKVQIALEGCLGFLIFLSGNNKGTSAWNELKAPWDVLSFWVFAKPKNLRCSCRDFKYLEPFLYKHYLLFAMTPVYLTSSWDLRSLHYLSKLSKP